MEYISTAAEIGESGTEAGGGVVCCVVEKSNLVVVSMVQ